MALYKFKVSDAAGKISDILVEGDSQEDATRRLQRRNVMPLAFLGEGALSSTGKGGFSFRRRFDIIDFTDRLVPLLEADIPLERALAIVGEGLEDTFSADVVQDLRRGLHEGRKFSDLIRDRGRLFPRLYASIVEAGEEAGALPQVMGELRRFLVEGRDLRAYIVSASVYPLFILAASFVMISILLTVVVPRFAQVLHSTGQDLPASTRLLVGTSTFMGSYWWVFPAAIVAVLFAAVQIRRGGRLQSTWDEFLLGLPVLGRMVLLSNLARMARTMAILMRSGVHLLDTVAIANRVVQNTPLNQSISGLAAELRQGRRLSHALSQSRFVPQFMLRMVAVGEETGSVDTMLDRVADRYEGDLRRMIKRTLSLFEPIVIIALGVLVAGIVLSMFLAIMEMQSGF